MVVVGNLVVGGTGKTPLVMALVQALRQRGWTPGVIARGHGAAATHARRVSPGGGVAAAGDEPLLIALRTQVPVWVGHDRRAVAQALLSSHPEVDIVISDDGLQRPDLPRAAAAVVFDARGIGNGRLLPAGPLREPFTAQVPARTVVLYNAPSPSTPWPGSTVRRALAGAAPLAAWWKGEAPSVSHLHALTVRPVVAAAGIGDPERFFLMLEAEGLTLRRLPLRDHADLATAPWPAGDEPIVVTEKDAVKLRPDHPDASRLHVVTLDCPWPETALQALCGWLPASPIGHASPILR